MYNTQFNVKYNDIETELLNKLKNGNEYDYNSEDVLDICSKLYRDELLSVFNAENLMDDKIDKCMTYVYGIMMTNDIFKILIRDLEEIGIQQFVKDKNYEEEYNIKQFVLMSLFSQDIFYITHKCICQQINFGVLNDDLLVELRLKSTELLKTM